MRAALALALLLAPAVLAGCVNLPAADGADLQSVTDPLALPPAVDAAATLAGVESYSKSFPLRRGDSDAHNAARAFLLKGFADAGLQTVEDEFEAPISPTSTPTALVVGRPRLVNLCGIKWGATAPQEWIVVGSHYDVTDLAVYGAYDDGSGTIIVQDLARAYASVPTARTILFCNFDGEEQGLRGSRHMVEALMAGEWVLNNGTVVGMVDFDMAGIMFPADPPLVADVVSPEMKAVIAAKAADLGVPEDKVEYRPISGGNSDNGPFKDAGIPSVLFISAFDEVTYRGVELPSPQVKYPFWHRLDTYEGMVEMAGGEENLRAGFQNVIDIGNALLWEMANGLEMTFEDPGA